MKAILFFITIMMLFVAHAQVQHEYIRVADTDAAYTTQDSHLVARNVSNNNGKLFLFIGGTFSRPEQYEFFSLYAAGLGYDVINISFLNSVLTTLLASNSDSLSFDKFRQEICFGTQVSPAVNVDSINSIYTRTVKLLQYLAQQYPNERWQEYLLSANEMDWSKVAVSGHSQGAGHAAYFAKHFSVERSVMFAGPNDYSTYFNNAAPWLRNLGATALHKHFAFFHLRDEIVPFNRQFENLNGMGMLQNDDTTLIDNIAPPYGNSRCLYSDLNPAISNQFHNSVIIETATPLSTNNEPIFEPVWEYMLLSDVSTGIAHISQEKFILKIYPNPVASTLYIEKQDDEPIVIFDLQGKRILTHEAPASVLPINISALENGIYFVKNGDVFARFVKH